MVRWGIMSTGKIAHQFADTLKEMQDTQQLIAVGSRTQEAADKYVEEYKAIFPSLKGYTLDQFLEDDEIDAVYVCPMHAFHYEYVKRCLEKGKHVLCEKPFTMNEKEAEELFALAKEKGLFIMEGMWNAHLPIIKKLRELINAGELGDIKLVKADFGYVSQGIRLERKLTKELGGGSFTDVGVYTVGFPYMVYNKKAEGFRSMAEFNDKGTDQISVSIVKYPKEGFAVLTPGLGTVIGKTGWVYGSKARVYLPDFEEATEMTLIYNDGTEKTFKEPLRYTGFEYQIEATAKCIEEGKLECDVWSWADTIEVQRQMDCIRKEWNRQ